MTFTFWGMVTFYYCFIFGVIILHNRFYGGWKLFEHEYYEYEYEDNHSERGKWVRKST